MKKYLLFAFPFVFYIFSSLLLHSELSIAETFDDSVIEHIDYPDWFTNSPFNDLEEILDSVKRSEKKALMVLFTTEGCSYCDVFIRKTLGNSDIATEVRKNFASVGMEIFDDAELVDPQGSSMSIKQFAKGQGVEFSPSLLFFTPNGKRVLRLVGYQTSEKFKKVMQYIIDEEYDFRTFRDYLKQQKAVVSDTTINKDLIADSLFEKPPYALDRSHSAEKKPLLVIFETPSCEQCKDFHAHVLALKEIRKTLQQFKVVRLNKLDNKTTITTPRGSSITPASWYEQTLLTEVPALLFFDTDGNEVLKTDALVLRQRMMNASNYVLEEAYKKGWSYQRFARSEGRERHQKALSK